MPQKVTGDLKSPFGFGILDKGKDEEVKTAISNEYVRNLTMKIKSKGGKTGVKESFQVCLLIDMRVIWTGSMRAKLTFWARLFLTGGYCPMYHKIQHAWPLGSKHW